MYDVVDVTQVQVLREQVLKEFTEERTINTHHVTIQLISHLIDHSTH